MLGIDHATPVVYLLTAVMLLPLAYFIALARRKNDLYIRRIAGIDAIDEAIGCSVEKGRPAFFSTGLTGISPTLYACLGVLYYVAKRSAVYKNPLYVPQNNPEVLAITEDTVRSAYQAAGRSSYFNPGHIPFLSEEQFAYAAGYIGMAQRENAGAAFLFGVFAAESLILAEAGQQVGARQVGATTSPEQVAFFIVACDHTLIGEELYATGAYLTREPIQIGSLYAQDVAKLVIMFIIIVGVILATIDSFYPGTIPFDYQNFLKLGT